MESGRFTPPIEISPFFRVCVAATRSSASFFFKRLQMPLVRLTTSLSLVSAEQSHCARCLVDLVSECLGKPAEITMAVIDHEKRITFRLTEEPSILFEVEGIEVDPDLVPRLNEVLTDFAATEFQIPPERLFVKVNSVPRGMWAGNGKVF